jgi:hypothetical protein
MSLAVAVGCGPRGDRDRGVDWRLGEKGDLDEDG